MNSLVSEGVVVSSKDVESAVVDNTGMSPALSRVVRLLGL